jgi:hypothetical protein
MSSRTIRNLRWTACCLASGLAVITLAALGANYPQWWVSRGLVNPQSATNDYAAANSGQLKWFAAKAKDEMDAILPGGAGSAVSAMVASLSSSNNYSGVNAGQLKYVAAPFYDRIVELAPLYPTITNAFPQGVTAPYPWTVTTDDDDDFAAVNVGQLKYVFGFDFGQVVFDPMADSDGDGMPDAWEIQYFGNTAQPPSGDYDGDGANNLTEFLQGRDPTKGVAANPGSVVRLVVHTNLE